jgi:hypothetical protein
MSTFEEDVVDDFCGKLKDFRETLGEKQKELLDAICEVAWEISAEDDLESGFDGCYTPKQADLIVRYSAGEVEMLTGRLKSNMIKSGMIKSSNMIRWTAQP